MSAVTSNTELSDSQKTSMKLLVLRQIDLYSAALTEKLQVYSVGFLHLHQLIGPEILKGSPVAFDIGRAASI